MCTVSSGRDRNDSPHWIQRRILRRVRSPPPDNQTSWPRTSFEYSAGLELVAADVVAGEGRSEAPPADTGRLRRDVGAAGACPVF